MQRPLLTLFPVPPPASDEVHLWAIPCDDPPLDRGALESLLSGPERARVERFHFDGDRLRATVARGATRLLLASYLDTLPRALDFEVGEHGKPRLRQAGAVADFNVSHAGDWVLLAIVARGTVGVDVERVRAVDDLERIVDRFFAPSEAQALRLLPQPQRAEAFFACWTRKEAVVKALGAGLSFPLAAFEVSVEPSAPAALLRFGGCDEAAAGWTLWSGAPAPSYHAAVAVTARPAAVRAWCWSGRHGAVPWNA